MTLLKNDVPAKPAGGRASCLPSALAAVLTVAVAVAGMEAFVRSRLSANLDRFAAMMPPVKLTGNALQTAAFRAPGVLPIYGSSELDRPAENRPDAFFLHRPTGFGTFPIGRAGNTCLLILEKLAAAGNDARGKEVAVFLSPTWFQRDASADAVSSNLRPRQLGAWVFGDELSRGLKRDIARRLLAYPEATDRDALLAKAVRDLAADTPLARLRFALLKPLGCMQKFLLARGESWALLCDMPTLLPSRRQRVQDERRAVAPASPTAAPDWQKLAAEAEAHDRAGGDTSPFCVGAPTIEAPRPRKHPVTDELLPVDNPPGKPVVPGERDADFYTKLARSQEWEDLALLFRVLQELGMRALIVSQPFNGVYRDQGGNSPEARRAYYDRLDTVVHQAGFEVNNFSEHEEDRTFFNDSGHPSAKAWIFYDHVLDDFVHARHHHGGPQS